MPWHVVPDHADCGDGKFAVVADDDGEVVSCHPSRDAAEKHMAALYANEGKGDGRNSYRMSRIADRHRPGGKEHDQSAHGRRKNVKAAAGKVAATVADFTKALDGLDRDTKDAAGDDFDRARQRLISGDSPSDVVASIRRNIKNLQSEASDLADELDAAEGEGGARFDRIETNLSSVRVQIRGLRRLADEIERVAAGKKPAPSARGGRSRILPDVCVRDVDFELRGRDDGGDGRTLEGYAAVFGHAARIADLKGDFDEVILPGAFTRSLRARTPIVQWDHGKDPRVGTVPIAELQDLREDGKGLYVRARLYDNPVVEPIRQAIAGRSIKGMSFRFSVPAGGDTWTRSRDVERREVRDADVFELGPVAFPAYDSTTVSVRSLLATMDPDEIRALAGELAGYLGRAVDLSTRRDPRRTDLTRRPARGAGGGDGSEAAASQRGATQSPDELRTRDRVLRAIGAIRG